MSTLTQNAEIFEELYSCLQPSSGQMYLSVTLSSEIIQGNELN